MSRALRSLLFAAFCLAWNLPTGAAGYAAFPFACEKAPTQPMDCTYLRPEHITAACSKRAEKPLFQEVKRRDEVKAPCLKILGFQFRNPISRRYDLRIVAGKFQIEQRVFFKPVNGTTPEQVRHFEERMNVAVTKIQDFYRSQGIEWKLKFSTDEKKKKELDPHDTVKFDFTERRSNSNYWKVGEEIELDQTVAVDKKKSKMGFPALAAHELSHLLGLDDHYEEHGTFCPTTKGKNGLNSKRSPFILCPSGKYTSGGLCEDLMKSGDPEVAAFTVEDLYSLVEPLCPGMCTFEAYKKYDLLDYPSDRESYLELFLEMKKKIASLPELEVTPEEEKTLVAAMSSRMKTIMSKEGDERLAMIGALRKEIQDANPGVGIELSEILAACMRVKERPQIFRVSREKLKEANDRYLKMIQSYTLDQISPHSEISRELEGYYDFPHNEVDQWTAYTQTLKLWKNLLPKVKTPSGPLPGTEEEFISH